MTTHEWLVNLTVWAFYGYCAFMVLGVLYAMVAVPLDERRARREADTVATMHDIDRGKA